MPPSVQPPVSIIARLSSALHVRVEVGQFWPKGAASVAVGRACTRRVRVLESMVVPRAVIAEQADRIVELERGLGQNSSSSSRPPSSDAPLDMQLPRTLVRDPAGRKPGKQPDSAGSKGSGRCQPWRRVADRDAAAVAGRAPAMLLTRRKRSRPPCLQPHSVPRAAVGWPGCFSPLLADSHRARRWPSPARDVAQQRPLVLARSTPALPARPMRSTPHQWPS